jgi:hypothetical protein
MSPYNRDCVSYQQIGCFDYGAIIENPDFRDVASRGLCYDDVNTSQFLGYASAAVTVEAYLPSSYELVGDAVTPDIVSTWGWIGDFYTQSTQYAEVSATCNSAGSPSYWGFGYNYIEAGAEIPY